ncbi:hypothetical protein P8629_09370 [Hydrogenovibrio sp. 3SP14C1]|uniref:hypothetical protein n=1 Tax=Hydrogenovibrio sp. 3SP14C1 TaxID=3038774 RepID=UPI0024166BD9|nr:hypothetical protein [Hydrogenovibrio sp. 3SP14C1]MDG4813213.1 hypothetical protein [Hydrogenovibrio sp. 3SP14C1]
MLTKSKGIYSDTKESIEKIQNFDVEILPRDSELCDHLNFHDSVQELIELYQKVSVVALEDCPADSLVTIQKNADDNYHLFQEMLNFDLEQNNPSEARITLLNQVSSAYELACLDLRQYIPEAQHNRRFTDAQTSSSDALDVEITEQEYRALLGDN